MKTTNIDDNKFKRIIAESLDYLQNGTFETENNIEGSSPFGDAIDKWVNWCFNFSNPNEWMRIFQGAPTKHFLDKFENFYDTYGSSGVMNRFYKALDSTNQQILIDYVQNNYKG